MRLETDQEALKDFVKTSYFSQGKKEKKTAQTSLVHESQSFYLSGTWRGVVGIF